jgi:hypothetical protein
MEKPFQRLCAAVKRRGHGAACFAAACAACVACERDSHMETQSLKASVDVAMPASVAMPEGAALEMEERREQRPSPKAARAKKSDSGRSGGGAFGGMATAMAPGAPPPPPPPADEADITMSNEAGGGEPGATPVLTRAWFPETFLFAPKVITDGDGKASLSVRVPDRLTTWRVLALAHARQGSQAGTVTTFASQLPVSVDVVVPSFLVAGDRVAVPIQLANMTSDVQRRTLAVSASSGRLDGSGGAVVIPERGSSTTTVWLEVKAPGDVAVEAKIQDDAMVKTVEVMALGEPRHTEQAGTLAAPRTITLVTADKAGAPIAGSEKVTARVFPGALAVLRAELASAPGRTSLEDDGAMLTLSALLPSLSTKLGAPVDDKILVGLRRLASQRLARWALSPSLERGSALSAGAALHDPDDLVGRTGERLISALARLQRPDGTFGGGAGFDVQRLMVATADGLLPILQVADAARRQDGGSSDAVAAKKNQAQSASIRARGAFERMLGQTDDAYTAAAVLMTGALDDDTKATLRKKITDSVKKSSDGASFLPVEDGVRRADGGTPSVVEATARALLALQDHDESKALRADLGAYILQSYRPGRGFGDGTTNRFALLAIAAAFSEPLPEKVAITMIVNDGEPTTEVLEGARLHDMVTLTAKATRLGESVKVVLSSEPALPGLTFVAAADWSVPFVPPAADAGLSLEKTLPQRLVVGTPATLSLTAVAPGGAPMTITIGLPAGVDVVTRSLEQLVEQRTITRFTVSEGTMTLEIPSRAQGELFTAKLQVVPTLAGVLSEREVRVAMGSTEVALPPSAWRIAQR